MNKIVFNALLAIALPLGVISCGDDESDPIDNLSSQPATCEYDGDMNIFVMQGQASVPCTPTRAQAVLSVSNGVYRVAIKPFTIEVPYGPMTIITGADLVADSLQAVAVPQVDGFLALEGAFAMTMPTDMGRGGMVDYQVKGGVVARQMGDSLYCDVAIPAGGWGTMPFAMAINFKGGLRK